VTGSILDVGAGVGQFLDLARLNFSSVDGTEISSTAVALAKKKFGLDLELGRVETIDFGDKKFDNISLIHVLEHVHDPGQTLTRCRDILSPGGILFIAVPNEINSLRRRVRKLKYSLGLKRGRYEGVLGIPKIRLDGSLNEIHLSHFTERSLSSALANYGFDVIETNPDPYYVSKGFRKVADTLYYMICSLINMITGRNMYDTLWIVGRKR
jgi:SAM-dependent methyltransferase